MSKPWFRPKQYGYGFTPASLEGALATVLYVVVVISTVRFLPFEFADHLMGMIVTALAVLLVTAAFLILCSLTVEGDMRWRWGRD